MACTPSLIRYGGNLVVSSTTRPTGVDLYAGLRIFEADTGRELLYDGTNWVIESEPDQVWAPTFSSGVTVGNGTWTSPTYHRNDGYIDIRGVFVLGTTSAITGVISLNLPIAAFSGILQQISVAFDDSAAQFYPALAGNSATAPTLYAQGAAGTYVNIATTSATVPFTWGTGDAINISGRYRLITRYS